MMDCLFVFSPGGENDNNYFFYNIGSAYIISFLRLNGYSADQFINNDLINLDNCIKKILLYNARVIGFSVFNTNFITSVLIADKIRKISPQTIIVFGGPSATNYSEFILNKYPFIDVCFRNESEEIFLQFMSQLAGNKFDLQSIDLGIIKGISYKNRNSIYINPDSNVLVNNSEIQDYLDKYPSPYLSGFIPGAQAYKVGLLTARGCNQHCIYCNCAVLSKRRFTTHSVDRVISELDLIAKNSYGNQIVNLYDDAFSLIPLRAKRICTAIIENKIVIGLSCITRCDCVDEELLHLMKDAGFVSIGFSLESANPKTLRIIGKVHKAEDNPSDELEKEVLFIERLGEISAYAKKIGIKNVFSSIMVGLPNETLEEANRTIETIDNHTGLDFYSHNVLNIYKGTPLYSTYHKYGYKIEFVDNNPIFSKTIFPDDTVNKVNVSSKSQIHRTQKARNKDALRILSLVPEKDFTGSWFNNVIVFSDYVDKHFVEWLTEILAINGTIIQIYSDKEALLNHSWNNFEAYVKYFTPSLNIQNHYLKSEKNLLQICNYSPLLKFESEYGSIKICDFDFVKSNLDNTEVDFTKIICKEFGLKDANAIYDYLCGVKTEMNLFEYLIDKKPFPYFSNLCKWTSDLTNCKRRNTLIINEKSEVKLCWYGESIGMVGQSYDEIINNFESDQKRILDKRKCNDCSVKQHCSKCISPFPISDEEYCIKRNTNNIAEVAESFISFDVLKQYM